MMRQSTDKILKIAFIVIVLGVAYGAFSLVTSPAVVCDGNGVCEER